MLYIAFSSLQGRETNWRFSIRREGDETTLRCALHNIRGDARMETVRDVHSALERSLKSEIKIELVPSHHFDPRPEDLAEIAGAQE